VVLFSGGLEEEVYLPPRLNHRESIIDCLVGFVIYLSGANSISLNSAGAPRYGRDKGGLSF